MYVEGALEAPSMVAQQRPAPRCLQQKQVDIISIKHHLQLNLLAHERLATAGLGCAAIRGREDAAFGVEECSA